MRYGRDGPEHFGIDDMLLDSRLSSTALTSRATSRAEARMASWVVPPRCGVQMTLFSSSKGLAVSGSLAKTSSAAPAIHLALAGIDTGPFRPPPCRGRS